MEYFEYCRHCGKKTVFEKGSIHHYDTRTGKTVYNAKIVCPNKTRFFNLHTDVLGLYYEETEEFHSIFIGGY